MQQKLFGFSIRNVYMCQASVMFLNLPSNDTNDDFEVTEKCKKIVEERQKQSVNEESELRENSVQNV